MGRKGGHRGVLGLTGGIHLGLAGVELAFVPGELEVDRARRAGCGHPEGLTQHVGNPLDGIDRGVHLGHGLEGGDVVDLLIHLAELGVRIPPSGEGDDRGVGEEGVA